MSLTKLLFVCLLAAPAAASVIWEAGGLAIQQTGGGLFDIPGGTKFWQTQVRVTNNNPFAVSQAGFLNTSTALAALAGLWDDTTRTWTAGALTSQQLAASQLPIGMTTVPPTPANGITASSSPSFRTVGNLAAGESVDLVWWDEVSDAAGGYFFNGSVIYRRDDPYYRQTSLGFQQTGLRVIDLPGGPKLWASTITWTNTGSTTLDFLYLINSANVGGNAAAWNNNSRTFTYGSLSMAAVNPISYHLLSRTNVAPSGPGVTAGSALPAYSIGVLAPGESRTVEWWMETDAGVGGLLFGGVAVGSEVPEPSTAIVCGIGLAVLRLLKRVLI